MDTPWPARAAHRPPFASWIIAPIVPPIATFIAAFIAVLIAALGMVAGPAHAGAEYLVQTVPGHPGRLAISLPLPPAVPDQADSSRRLIVRGEAWGLTPQIEAPHCDGEALRRDAGGWRLPAGCHTVRWWVDALRLPPEGAHVAAQASLWLPSAHWVLLSEPTSLLRLADDGDAATLRAASPSLHVVGGAEADADRETDSASGLGAGDKAWRVPPGAGAPAFYAIGAARPVIRRAGVFLVRHVADDIGRVDRAGWLDMHGQLLAALGRLVFTGGTPPRDARRLLVVWVGLDAALAPPGGAGGSRSLLVNYPVGGETSSRREAMMRMLIAHEQFHQLADIVRTGLPPLPAWVGESLAHYYALRLMAPPGAPNDAPMAEVQALRDKFIDPGRPLAQRLPEIEALFATDRSRAAALAYTQGATFWSELDRALRGSTRQRHTLDEALPRLLRGRFPANGGLPAEFIAWLYPEKRIAVEAVLDRYVGRAP